MQIAMLRSKASFKGGFKTGSADLLKTVHQQEHMVGLLREMKDR